MWTEKTASHWPATMCVGALLTTVWAASSGTASAASFIPLGQLDPSAANNQGYGVSADGTVVTGRGHTSAGGATSEGWIWTLADGFTLLGDLPGGAVASGSITISDDGLFAAGGGSDAVQPLRPVRWAVGGPTIHDLGPLLGGNGNGQARGINQDGSVVVGMANSSNTGPTSPPGEAFRWYIGPDGMVGTPDDEMVGLGDPLAGGPFYSIANGVSPDGDLVVGSAFAAVGGDEFAYKWIMGADWATPIATALDGLIVGGQSIARDTSGDGQVILGTAESAPGSFKAVLWNAGGVMALGQLPGGGTKGVAEAASLDGSVVVGFDEVGGNKEAFIWDSLDGMRSVRGVLEHAGVDLSEWNALGEANGVSAAGTVITGVGLHNGVTEPWVAIIMPEPVPSLAPFSVASLLCLLGATAYRRLRILPSCVS